jgi:hypothetical protein
MKPLSNQQSLDSVNRDSSGQQSLDAMTRDKTGIFLESHVKIFDPKTCEVIVNKRG